MKISHFAALVFVAASMIVVGVYTTDIQNSASIERSIGDPGQPPDYYFLTADRDLDSQIDCPLARVHEGTEFWDQGIPLCWLAEGWTQPLSWGVWATGAVSRVEVNVDTSAPRVLLIRARANRALAVDQQQIVSVSINGQTLEEKPVARRWTRLRYRIPRGMLKPGSNTIELRFSERISPSQAGDGKDPTTLAAGISQLSLTAPTGRSSTGQEIDPTYDVWDDANQVFMIGQPGTLLIPVFIPPGTGHIELDIFASLGADSSKSRAILAIEGLDGAPRPIEEIEIQPGRSLRTARLPAADLEGQWALASVETPIEVGRLKISRPRFKPHHRNPIKQDRRPETARENRPDVILITLDAARADHFSFAGHPRLTTPFIDELTRESLVFTNAYALVPYTLGSVPTMITGLSFIDHGVVGHEDVLSQDAVTLAEVLAQSGYHTACFSATPNNSRAKGFDQGYEIFREIWTEGKGRKENRRARFMAKTVVKWLHSIKDDDRPLHLQVHMVPPHEPYDPSPRFDLFTDPNYEGPCDGFHKTLSAINGGSMEATPECIDHLLSLYDGNLRAADHAVKRIVDALRGRPTWRNTVVLVTSDHGEAFLDHGKVGHNSTVFSEMLHVPFVLRMPAGFDASSVDTGRLATLGDIMPTLLSASGLPTPKFHDSVDLLETDPTPGGRFFVSQTATGPPVHGIRTLRWSLMVNAAGSGAFFDLSIDPEEKRNSRLNYPMEYVGLGKILSSRIKRPAQLAASVTTTDITDEERVLLETLGYIVD